MTLSIFFLLNKVCLFRQNPPNKKAREVSAGYLLRVIKTSSQKYSGRECTTDSVDDRLFQCLHAEKLPISAIIDAIHPIQAFFLNRVH